LPDNTLIKFDNVSYKIDDFSINEDISFFISPKDLISIIGPNGSGKTTLLRLISGELRPTSGGIFFKGKNIINWDPMDLACERSMLSQLNNLSFPFKVYDVIQMGRFPVKQKSYLDIDIEKKIMEEILGCFDLKELINKNYLVLSGGEKQRVQLARTFIQIWTLDSFNDKLIILDEPTSFLDIYYQLKLYKLIKKLNNKGLAFIMVLHDINHAFLYSKKVMMMENARLKYFGDVKKIINEKNIKDIFKVKLSEFINKYKYEEVL